MLGENSLRDERGLIRRDPNSNDPAGAGPILQQAPVACRFPGGMITTKNIQLIILIVLKKSSVWVEFTFPLFPQRVPEYDFFFGLCRRLAWAEHRPLVWLMIHWQRVTVNSAVISCQKHVRLCCLFLGLSNEMIWYSVWESFQMSFFFHGIMSHFHVQTSTLGPSTFNIYSILVLLDQLKQTSCVNWGILLCIMWSQHWHMKHVRMSAETVLFEETVGCP